MINLANNSPYEDILWDEYRNNAIHEARPKKNEDFDLASLRVPGYSHESIFKDGKNNS